MKSWVVKGDTLNMELYVNRESIFDSINYFKNLNIKSGEQLGLFLLFKHLGITTTNKVKTKALSNTEKSNMLNALYRLGGLFSLEDEDAEKRACLFPLSFKSTELLKDDFYNGGTK